MKRAGLFFSLLLAACGTGKIESFSRTLTSTVAVGSATDLVVDAWLPLDLVGTTVRSDILVEVDVTMTSSTSTLARERAALLGITVDRPTDGQVRVRFLPPKEGQISGTMRVTLPATLTTSAQVNAGTARVTGTRRPVMISALSGLEIGDVEDDVTAEVLGGPILINSALFAGRTIQAVTRQGDIEVRLPSDVSANIFAEAHGQGAVTIEHPSFPPAFGINRNQYAATVNGGASTLRLAAQNGNIIVRLR